jgi:PKD repeat protein
VTDYKGATGTVTKDVTVTAPPVNAKPTAAFTSSASGLASAFDGSGSSDADGTIASYSWDFGDKSAAGTEAKPSHTYAKAGTYPVTLTVTDNQGATGTLTKDVTVTAPVGPSVLASDDFQRTVTGGWGTAVKGGAWTGTGTSSNYGVNGTAGSMTMPTAGTTRSMTLAGLSAADTDTTVKVSFDKIPNVAGSYAIVGSRQFTTPGGTTANGYRAKVRLDATGGAQLTLSRVVGGTETTVRTAVTVPGVKLTAGSDLQIRMQTQGSGTTTLRARAWLAGTPEPTTWLATATDTTAALQTTGGLYLSTYLTSSSTNIPVVGRWDDLVVSSF